jgi:hypothetical protein
MGLALAVGVIANLFFVSEAKPPFRVWDLIPLISYYVPFCVLFLAIMLLWNKWIRRNIYSSWLLVLVSVFVLGSGLYAFPIREYQGVHLILVSFLGFFLSSTDQLVQHFKAAPAAGIQE